MDARKDEVNTRRFEREDYGSSPAPGRGYSAVETTEDPDMIKARIDRTRAEMDLTVRALQDRLNVNRLMMEGKNRAAYFARTKGVPLALIGTGIGWMLMERKRARENRHHFHVVAVPFRAPDEVGHGRDQDWLAPGAQYWEQEKGIAGRARDRLGDVADRGAGVGRRIRGGAEEVADRVRDAASDVGNRVSRAGGSIRHGFEDASSRARHVINDTGDRVSDLGHDLRKHADRAREGAIDTYEQNPLIMGAGALALGLLLGLAVPTTRAENKVMGETSDELARRARRLGKDALNKGQEVAQKVIETARTEARNADTDDLVDKAKQVVTSVAGAARDEVVKAGREVIGTDNKAGGTSGSTGSSGSSMASGIGSQKSQNQSQPGIGGANCPTNTGKPVI
jgi:vacuolar-type H+-ATPase subunit H